MGHVALVGEEKKVYKDLEGNPKGKRPLACDVAGTLLLAELTPSHRETPLL
jgi:hypothetical protein